MINPKELPSAWLKGLTVALLLGAGTLYFGRDTLYFPNGSGGDDWRIGRAQVNIFNAHARRSPEEMSQQALALVNRDRTLNGLKPLELDPVLSQVAQAHAADMVKQGYFDRVAPDGQRLDDRLRAAGEAAWIGDNLLAGENWGEALVYRNGELLQRQGMYDRGHRENLLNPDHTHGGFGLVADAATGDVYAVQLFRGGKPGAIAAQQRQALSSAASAASSGSQNTAPAPAANASAQAAAQAAASDPFRDAVNAATRAANLTQTATLPQEWAVVAGEWQRAIANMKAVPGDHPRHAVAQQKVQEYGNNLAYAQQNAGGAIATTPATTSATKPASSSPNAAATAPQVASITSFTQPAVAPSHGAELSPTQSLGPFAFSSPSAIVPAIAQSGWSKLLLMLLAGGGLAWVLCLGSGRSLQSPKEDGKPNPARDITARSKPVKEPLPWGLLAYNLIHDLWEAQPFFNTERVYKMTAASSAHKLQRKLYRRLLSLTKDQATAMQLIKDNLRRHPKQSVNWCCEQAIKDLEKQRQRESTLMPQRSGNAPSSARRETAMAMNPPDPPSDPPSGPLPDPTSKTSDSPDEEESTSSERVRHYPMAASVGAEPNNPPETFGELPPDLSPWA